MGNRLEKDFLGAKELAHSVYYGMLTLRGEKNFHITGIPTSLEPKRNAIVTGIALARVIF